MAQDKRIVPTLKTDALNFRNQITRITEYKEEQKKVKALSAANKEPVKVKIEIDIDSSALEEETDITDTANNILTGYIKEESAMESIVAYELHFDRTTKKIISIVYQLEATEGKLEKTEEQ
jgi:hypothetical protein